MVAHSVTQGAAGSTRFGGVIGDDLAKTKSQRVVKKGSVTCDIWGLGNPTIKTFHKVPFGQEEALRSIPARRSC